VSGDAWLVVGLGNPGPGYTTHRHNVGNMVLDELASRLGVRFTAHKGQAVAASARLGAGGARVILAKPSVYMNVSGGPVAALRSFYDVEPQRIIVVHDELDIPFDSIRLKDGGGHGGNNGVRSIVASLGSPDFLRVRVGIGRPPGRQDPADYVLSSFTKAEREILPSVLSDAADAVEDIMLTGLQAAQQKHHAPRP